MTHDWEDMCVFGDVGVIGEHQVSNRDWRSTFLEVWRYVRDIFSVQPTRRFIHAFTILGT
jgi:Fungal protein kinase